MLIEQIFRSLRGLRRDSNAVSAVEFGLMAPLLMMAGAGGLEFINYVLAYQKIERIASISADNIARNMLAPSERSFADTFAGIDEVAAPFDIQQRGRVILTGVIGVPDNGNIVGKVVWQRCSGQLAGVGSAIGQEADDPDLWAEGDDATLPNGLNILQNQLVVISEVTYEYEPLININQLVSGPPEGRIRQLSVFVSRGQAFPYVTPSSGVTAPDCD